MPGDNLLRPVNLFREHAARQKMRPGQPAKRQGKISPRPYRVVQPIRATDQKGDATSPFIAPTTNTLRQLSARKRLASFIQCDDGGGVRNLVEQQPALLASAFVGRKLFTGFDLHEVERPAYQTGIIFVDGARRLFPGSADCANQDSQRLGGVGRGRLRRFRNVVAPQFLQLVELTHFGPE